MNLRCPQNLPYKRVTEVILLSYQWSCGPLLEETISTHVVEISRRPQTELTSRARAQKCYWHDAWWSRHFVRRIFQNYAVKHGIHLWHIYLHLVDFHGKCRWIYHTWILWTMQFFCTPVARTSCRVLQLEKEFHSQNQKDKHILNLGLCMSLPVISMNITPLEMAF